ncbi:MAG: hypothetical protein GY696_01030, partial [Gammaproteobacteria bacterium]|nr:hypothetical protein [Gammaproteobacteria bacterium]
MVNSIPRSRINTVKDDDPKVLVKVSVTPVSSTAFKQKEIEFRGDTAAQVTTLNERVFKKAFHGLELLPPDKTLAGFMKTCSVPLGKFEAEVVFGDKPAAKIDIYVVKEPGLSLLGIREMGVMDIRTRQRTV